MAITLEQTSETTITGTSTSHNITLPSTGIDADDLIVIVCSTQESSDAGAPTTPTGYTQRFSLGHASSFRPRITCVYKVADGTEESNTVTFTWGTGVETHIVAMVFRGVDTTTPFDATEGGPTNGGSNPDPAAITTATDDAWVIPFVAGNRSPSTSSPTISSGYTSVFDQTPDSRAFVIFRKEVATAGSENPGAMTWSPIDNHTTVTAALRPATDITISADQATETDTALDQTLAFTGTATISADQATETDTALDATMSFGFNVDQATEVDTAHDVAFGFAGFDVTSKGLISVQGSAPVAWGHGGQQVDTGLTIEWDLDNDGDYSEAVEDVTGRVMDADMIAGRDFPSQLHGRSTPGKMQLVLDNSDDAFTSTSSALNTDPFEVEIGQRIRVRQTSVSADRPTAVARDRWRGAATKPAVDELGNEWTVHNPALTVADTGLGTFDVRMGSVGDGELTMDPGLSSGYVQATFDVKRNDQPVLMCRWADTDNNVFVEYFPGFGLWIYEVVAGSETILEAVRHRTVMETITIGIDYNGSTCRVFQQGRQIASVTTTDSTSTAVGIKLQRSTWTGTGPKCRDFGVWSKLGLAPDTDGPIWSGYVSDIRPQVDRRRNKTVVVTARGPLAKAERKVPSPGATNIASNIDSDENPTSGDLIGLPFVEVGLMHPPADGAISTNGILVLATPIPSAQALTIARKIEDTEAGWLYETRDGDIGFAARVDRGADPIRSGWGDSTASQFRFESVRLIDNSREIVNEVSPEIQAPAPRWSRVKSAGTSTASGVNNAVTNETGNFVFGTEANPGDLSITVLASTVYTEGEFWLVPDGYVEILSYGDTLGRIRVYAKILTEGDSADTQTYYADTANAGGSFVEQTWTVTNWYGDIDQGIVAMSLSKGSPASTTEAQGGQHQFPSLALPWGDSVGTRSFVHLAGMTSTNGTQVSQPPTAADGSPYGYQHAATVTREGVTSDADDVTIFGAASQHLANFISPTNYGFEINGYDHLDAVVIAVRGYSGPDKPASGGQVVTVRDQVSIDSTGVVHRHPTPGRLFKDVDQANDYASHILTRFKNPRRLLEVKFTASKSSTYRTEAATRRLGDRIYVDLTGNSGIGASGVFIIESVQHRLYDGAKIWETTWTLSEAV